EQALLEDFRVWPPAQDLHKARLDVDGRPVVPARARLVQEWHAGEFGGHLRERVAGVDGVHLAVALAHRGRISSVAVGKACRVTQDVANRRGPRGCAIFSLPALLTGIHLDARKFRQVLLQRLVETKTSFVVKRHQYDACQWLGHGEDADQGIASHWSLRLPVRHPVGAGKGFLAVFEHKRRYTDEFSPLNESS